MNAIIEHDAYVKINFFSSQAGVAKLQEGHPGTISSGTSVKSQIPPRIENPSTLIFSVSLDFHLLDHVDVSYFKSMVKWEDIMHKHFHSLAHSPFTHPLTPTTIPQLSIPVKSPRISIQVKLNHLISVTQRILLYLGD